MTFDELEGASEEQLRKCATTCLDEYSQSRQASRLELLLEAEFFMRELEHREAIRDRKTEEQERKHNRRIAWRDFILEALVILLIGVEIYQAWRQGNDQGIMMAKEIGLLNTLQLSASATAESVQKLPAAMDGMSANISLVNSNIISVTSAIKSVDQGVHEQLSLFYDPAVSVMFDINTKQLKIGNQGRSNIEIVSIKYENNPLLVLKPAQSIAPSIFWFADGSKIYKALLDKTPKGTATATTASIEFHIANEIGKHFRGHATLVGVWMNDQFNILSQPEPLEPEK